MLKVNYFDHRMSIVCTPSFVCPSGICQQFLQTISPPKPLAWISPNITGMILRWSPFNISKRFQFRAEFWLPWQPKQKTFKNLLVKMQARFKKSSEQMVFSGPSTKITIINLICCKIWMPKMCKHLKRQDKKVSENVVCWSRLLQIIALHYRQIKYRSKQHGPRTDCSYRSSRSTLFAIEASLTFQQTRKVDNFCCDWRIKA